ncbi:MAG: GntR family transcriptional regulator [Clostridia bacterium]|nr:GntR family transcriptional regulator [Clostridia bacterium]
MIHLDYKSGKSIHEQIYDNIKSLIISGIFKEDDKLPSVRELSISLTVNPNTVQKAYKELENDGFIYSLKAKGNFVARYEKADGAKVEKLLEDLRSTLSELKFSGVEESRIVSTVKEIYKEEKHD